MCGARWRTANTRRQCDFTFSFLTRKQLCCDFAGGQSDTSPQKLSKQTLKFSPAFFKRRRNPKAAPLVALRTGRNSFLQGSAGGEAKQSGGLFCRGEPSPGVPRCTRRRAANRDFYFVPKTALSSRHRLCKCFADRDKPCPYERFVIHLAQNNKIPLSAILRKGGLFCFIPECRGFSAVCRNRPANLRRSEYSRALCRP